ncbi:unnamed protein product, partial [Brenthis ino]
MHSSANSYYTSDCILRPCRENLNMLTFITIFDLSILVFVTSMFFENVKPGTINIPEDIVEELYLKYKEAAYDRGNISLRRLFKNNKQYEVHVKKLKEVNGFKTHNLMIKESLRTDSSSLIYINNPVESKIPRAYLTLEEFKNILTDRVLKQRTKLIKNNVTNGKTKLNDFKHHDAKKPATNVIKNNNITLSTKKLKLTDIAHTKHINFTHNVQDEQVPTIQHTRQTTNIYNTVLTNKKAQVTKNEIESAIIVVSNITEMPAMNRIKINNNTLSTRKLKLIDIAVTKYINFTPNIQNTTMNAFDTIASSNKTEININVSEPTKKPTKNVTIKSEISNKPKGTMLVSEESTQYIFFRGNDDITSQSFTENITQVSTKKEGPSRKTTETFIRESNIIVSPKQRRTTLGVSSDVS